MGYGIGPIWMWLIFTAAVLVMMVIDIIALHKQTSAMSKKQAILWTLAWIGIACAFGYSIGHLQDIPGLKASEAQRQFFAAYLLEYSLSIDNLFIFVLLFRSFKVPEEFQHRVLFWGILGAVILRAVFVFGGLALVHRFEAILWFFGALLFYTGIKLVLDKEDDGDVDVEKHTVVRIARKLIPVSSHYDGKKFFTRINGALVATPLFLVLVSVELSDIMFAVDSVPAVFGISQDVFIVYTSNILAVLGLRALYFLLSGSLWALRFLPTALGVVLCFIGMKLLLPFVHHMAGVMHWNIEWLPHKIHENVSLMVIGSCLALGIVFSLLVRKKPPDSISSSNDLQNKRESE